MAEYIYGVDTSQWQGNKINWNKLIQATATKKPVEFIFGRANYGTYSDRYFAKNWQQAKNHGLPRGPYLYYYQSVSGEEQANAFIRTVGSDKGELPPVIDVEEPTKVTWTGTQVAQLKKCAILIEQAFGRKPLIYTNKFYWEHNIGNVNMGCQLWLAQWYKQWDEAVVPDIPDAWSNQWAFWQYSAFQNKKGAEYGVASVDIDLDVFNGNREQFEAYLAQ